MENDTLTMSPKAKMICTAIQSMLRVHFVYNRKERIGEPQCCGITTADHEGVRMRMIKGGSRDGQLFKLSKITSLQVLDERFYKTGPNYKRHDSAMKIIYCQLD